ncbi:unnamed protein product [Ceutorhynchus assimilis]|uniref:Uncharacterized protein n=1 Tax=Ceutorhynchus assimilis TaxID=467358 RepID=A0A9N9MGR4_9CUCU|nr:unnamed protein product [Ceutorhynchus assimilis]
MIEPVSKPNANAKSIISFDPSGKLDFGSSEETIQPRNVKLDSMRNTDSSGSASDKTKSVVCGTGGCNATQITNNTIETEVLIHVQTKVNLNHDEKKKFMENSSDVPIVVGYKGSNPNRKPFDIGYGNDIPSREYGDYPPYFRPTYTNPPINIGPSFNQRNGFDNYGFSTFRPPIGRNYYGFPGSSTTFAGGFYGSTTHRPLDLHYGYAESPPNLNRPRHYNNNRVELQVPHFEHGYNKHYFREEPPPHNILLDRGNAYNPVEFRPTSWTPSSSWGGRNYKFEFSDHRRNYGNPSNENQLPGQLVHHDNHGVDCSCRNSNAAIPHQDLNIYAASSLNPRIAVPDKKITIDNKLAPLN